MADVTLRPKTLQLIVRSKVTRTLISLLHVTYFILCYKYYHGSHRSLLLLGLGASALGTIFTSLTNLNEDLYVDLFESLEEAVPAKGGPVATTMPSTLIAAFAAARLREIQIGATVLLIGVVSHLWISHLISETPTFTLIWFLLAAALFLQGSAVSLIYRVNHGLLGTTEYEARQLIAFALTHANDIDLTGLGISEINLDSATARALASAWGLEPS